MELTRASSQKAFPLLNITLPTQSPYSLKYLRNIKARPKKTHLIPIRIEKRFSVIKNSSFIESSTIKLQDQKDTIIMKITDEDSEIFMEQLNIKLRECKGGNSEFFKVYEEVFDMISEFLRPFSSILNELKKGLLDYGQVSNAANDTSSIDILQGNYRDCKAVIERLNKDKANLLAKLENLSVEYDKMKDENNDIKKRHTEILRRYGLGCYAGLGYDDLKESLRKANKRIERQNKKIGDLLENEIKFKKAYELIKKDGYNLEHIFELVNLDFMNIIKPMLRDLEDSSDESEAL